jgi:hypothetical protein
VPENYQMKKKKKQQKTKLHITIYTLASYIKKGYLNANEKRK